MITLLLNNSGQIENTPGFPRKSTLLLISAVEITLLVVGILALAQVGAFQGFSKVGAIIMLSAAGCVLLIDLIKANLNKKSNFFIDILNTRKYFIDGKEVSFPKAGKPEKFVRGDNNLQEYLNGLREKYHLNNGQRAIQINLKNRTTEQAIAESNSYVIALNFANAIHAGGHPGFYKDPQTQLFVYDHPSSQAQEESLCLRSDLLDSLTQLPHEIVFQKRSQYTVPFDSRTTAYRSINSLFATQSDRFHSSTLLDAPKSVAFITSAATNYRLAPPLNKNDFNKDAAVYQDAKARIETHLCAAALEACIAKEKPNLQVEFIGGAFGCGAFAPINGNDYREMIANIYKELLPHFQGFFDEVTFAIPTFGNSNPSSPSYANYSIFRRVLRN